MTNKYRNKKTTLCLNCGIELEEYKCPCADPYTFDSKKEAARYQEINLMIKAGIVKEVGLQPGFVVLDGYVKNGKKVRPIVYRADFHIYYSDGREVIEDVKGKKTQIYLLKKKLFEKAYPDLTITEI